MEKKNIKNIKSIKTDLDLSQDLTIKAIFRKKEKADFQISLLRILNPNNSTNPDQTKAASAIPVQITICG